MAEQTAIITSADVTGRLSTQAYARLFAKNGGATADTTFRDLCIAEANSEIRVLLRAAFPDGLYTTTDTLDAAIVGRGVDLVCAIAASRHASYDEEGAYAQLGKNARAFFRSLSRDADARAPGSSAVRPVPRASNVNTEDSAGVATNPFTRAADRLDSSDF